MQGIKKQRSLKIFLKDTLKVIITCFSSIKRLIDVVIKYTIVILIKYFYIFILLNGVRFFYFVLFFFKRFIKRIFGFSKNNVIKEYSRLEIKNLNDKLEVLTKWVYRLTYFAIIIVILIFLEQILNGTIGYLFKWVFSVFAKMDNKPGKIFNEFSVQLWQGIRTTLILSVIGTAIGLFIAMIFAVLATQKITKRDRLVVKVFKRISKVVVKIYVTVIRSTPMMVQGVLIYYVVLKPYFGWSAVETLAPAITIVAVNTTAYLTEVLRGGISSIDKGQTEGSRSLGISSFQTFVSVIYPQAIKNSMPAIGNELIINIKDTAVLNVIMVYDIFTVAKTIQANKGDYMTPYLIAAALYLVITLCFSLILGRISKKLDVKNTVGIPSSN